MPHACKDHSDIRLKFFERIRKIDYFGCYVVIGRKIPEIFIKKHNSNATEFYFDLLRKLIEQISFEISDEYQMYLARRQSTTNNRFSESVRKVIQEQEVELGEDIKYKCDVVKSSEFPEMSVIDYMLWALQRYILKGEKRFFNVLKDRYKIIYDIYDEEAESKIYTPDNIFDIKNASDFRIS